jgi:hypothetical protein
LVLSVFLFALAINFTSFFDFICCSLFAMAELSINQALSQDHYNDNTYNSSNKENYSFVLRTMLPAKTNAATAGIILPATVATATAATTTTTAPQQKSSLLYDSLSLTTILTGSDNGNNSNNTTTAATTAIDSDRNGLTDIQEIDTFRTNINKSDSDKDQLSDGKEVNGWLWFVEEQRGCVNATRTITCHVHKTNPLSPDTDGDRNSDYYEYINFGSKPIDPDQDKDGLLDGLESGPNGIYHTSFFAADTDKDGLSDRLEIETAGRDPTKPDILDGERGEDIIGPAEEPGINANDAPIASPQRVVTVKNDPVDIILIGSDKDSDTLYFFLAAHPLHGTLSTLMVTGSASAKLTYTPVPNYAGEDSFTFWTYDGNAYSSSPGRVSIYISR